MEIRPTYTTDGERDSFIVLNDGRPFAYVIAGREETRRGKALSMARLIVTAPAVIALCPERIVDLRRYRPEWLSQSGDKFIVQ